MATWTDRYWNSADGVKLHYRDHDGNRDRPPILCIPGLTRNARDFEPVAEAAVRGLPRTLGAKVEQAPLFIAQLGEQEAAAVADIGIVHAEQMAEVAQRQRRG